MMLYAGNNTTLQMYSNFIDCWRIKVVFVFEVRTSPNLATNIDQISCA